MSSNIDVAIFGGGLAGLTLARQLKLEMPEIKICVLERTKSPSPEAAHKVGESSVEVGAHYFGSRLGLADHVDTLQLPKLGLRYFLPDGDNTDISSRFEIGPSDFPKVPSYQLDRGRFENYIRELNIENDIQVIDGARVQAFQLNPEGKHEVSYIVDKEAFNLTARWVVDASGRNNVIKRKLNLKKEAALNNNSVWFRIDEEIDLTTWCNDPEWKKRANVSKRFSTNHLMGPGYWVWLIPLGSGSTSVGIVADAEMHDLSIMNSFEKALEWLHANEPQCGKVIEGLQDKLMDFKALKRYSHSCKEVFSAERWCLTGDAGVFIDPFYSPGSDFIAYSNDFISDLIVRDLGGEDIRIRAETYNRIYLNFSNTVFSLYEGLYKQFGNSFIMTQKILWDTASYLGVPCLLYFNKKFRDLEFLTQIEDDLAHYNHLLYSVGQHFTNKPIESEYNIRNDYLDLSKTFLYDVNLNQELLIEYDDDQALAAKLKQNISNLDRLSKEILADVNVARNFKLPEKEKELELA